MFVMVNDRALYLLARAKDEEAESESSGNATERVEIQCKAL